MNNLENSRMKKIGFSLILACFVLLTIDLGLQAIFYTTRGITTWQMENWEGSPEAKEVFNARRFTEPVNDERYVTAKRNYSTVYKGPKNREDWIIETDSYGFRIGGLNAPSKAGKNIVFVGDSVPFGWHMDVADTVPSYLHDDLVERGFEFGIINAAIPSYSLDQAVHRYKYEIAGKFPIYATILQIYDPASQFALLGPFWDVTKNWTASWVKPKREPDALWKRIAILKYSAIYYVSFRIYRLYGAFDRYIQSINHSLGVVLSEKGKDERILILPVTIPKKSWEAASLMRKMSIYILNRTMRNFAKQNTEVSYLDTIELFAGEVDEQIFIDQCCHLSEYGAKLQARFIADHLGLQ